MVKSAKPYINPGRATRIAEWLMVKNQKATKGNINKFLFFDNKKPSGINNRIRRAKIPKIPCSASILETSL